MPRATSRLLRFADPRRVLIRIRKAWAMAHYDQAASLRMEQEAFAALGLDIEAGRARLDAVLDEIGSRPFDHVDGDDSVHWLLFASLSLTDAGQSFRDILEIGTFRGKTAVILKLLFPQARVVTCDLPPDDPILASSYGRDDPALMRAHQERRDANVSREGITLVEANSFFLPERAPGPYDLIWVDGGHVFPEIAWDICNAWHMCRPGGIMMFDDIYTHPDGGDGIYGNYDACRTLEYLAARTKSEPLYFPKRHTPAWSADARQRKYVALARKI